MHKDIEAQQIEARHSPTSIDTRVIGVGFTFASIGVMALTLSISLFAQSGWAHAACALIYAGMIIVERHFKVVSPLSFAILVGFLALMVAGLMDFDIEGYTGVYVFAWLFFVVTTCHLTGRHFTSFYSNGKGLLDVHRTISLIWVIAYASSFVTSVALMPDYWYVVVPVCLCILASMATLFVSFIWCGRKNQREKSFERNGLSFSLISVDHPDFAKFCAFYAEAIVTHPSQEEAEKTIEESALATRDLEMKIGKSSLMFVCRDGEKLIATIRCAVDGSGGPLPSEREMNSSYDPLRRHGRVMEVGRFSIHEDYRKRSAIINGLFSFMVNVALERDVQYVFASGFPYVIPMYMKLGFEPLFRRSDRRFSMKWSNGFVMHPLVLDFSTLIFNKSGDERMKYGMYEMAQPYLAERWLKRTVVRDFTKRMTNNVKPRGAREIRQFVVDNQKQARIN